MPLATEVGLSPDNIVLNGAQLPPLKRDTAPNFRPMSIVTKQLRISATAELVLSAISTLPLWVSLFTSSSTVPAVCNE